VKVKIDGVTYKIHPDGDVFKVTDGWFGDSTLKMGRIPSSTPQNKLEEVIRAKFL
jgi:hypothetical protein